MMETDIEILRLEDFIDKLLGRFNQLKNENAELQQTLLERDAECANLKETLQSLSKEHNEVGNRVVDLIGRIEQWETEQGEGEATELANDTAKDNSPSSFFGADTNSDYRSL